jgi:hypothetical protein
MKFRSLASFTLLATLSGGICLLAAPPIPKSISLQSTTFEFPGAGERNNNRAIGDFCCTGETATLRDSDGTPVGYIYFHDFAGGINVHGGLNEKTRSAATRFGILVSGPADADHLAEARAKSSIEFSAAEMKPGLTRQTTAGALHFTATILGVKFLDDTHTRYWMDSVKLRVDVE